MSSINAKARLAGFLYLLWVIPAFIDMYFVPKVIIDGNATATMQNIAAHSGWFHAGILMSVVDIAIWVFLVLALHDLLKRVDLKLSLLMVVLVIVQLPFQVISVYDHLFLLELARDQSLAIALDSHQLEALGMLLLKVDGLGTSAAVLFWGLWLFPLGLLTLRSGFLPKFLGIWLILPGIAYVVLFFIDSLLPQYAAIGFKISFPFILGEIAFMLWLLIMGAKESQPSPVDTNLGH